MKKVALFMISFTMLFLVACGTGKDLSVEEVLTQMIEKVESIESYSADIKMTTSILDTIVDIEGKSDITHNPDTMYFDMKMGMPGMAMDIEMYYVDGKGYMSMFEEWFEMTEEEMQLQSFDQLNNEELDKYKAFADTFEMTEEDGKYVLSLEGEGEKFEPLVSAYLDPTMGGLGEEDMFEDTIEYDVTHFETKMWIDKKTMIMTEQTLKADLDMDGDTYTISSEGTIYNIDEVEPVVVPTEVVENAVTDDEIWEDDSEYVEQDYTVEEIQEMIDFTLPTIGSIPADYELVEAYYDEDYTGSVLLNYEKDYYNYFTVDIYPSLEAYGETAFEDMEEITINGAPAYFELIDGNYMYIMWEHNGLFIDLTGDGPDMTKELLMEIAESVE